MKKCYADIIVVAFYVFDVGIARCPSTVWHLWIRCIISLFIRNSIFRGSFCYVVLVASIHVDVLINAQIWKCHRIFCVIRFSRSVSFDFFFHPTISKQSRNWHFILCTSRFFVNQRQFSFTTRIFFSSEKGIFYLVATTQ